MTNSERSYSSAMSGEGEPIVLDDLPKDSWMVSPCEVYWEEYRECTRLRGRFHQYFIHGETKECTSLWNDYRNCIKWRKTNDKTALNKVIESETQRLRKRLKAMYENDVWEYRDEPPADWSKPLPEWMQKQNEGSYLQAMKDLKSWSKRESFSSKLWSKCSIS